MNKLEVDGMVAIIYSPGYGAGWASWNPDHRDVLFDLEIILWIMAGDLDLAERVAEEKWPDVYIGGLRKAKIKWLPVGTRFKIYEHDGYERIELLDDSEWYIA